VLHSRAPDRPDGDVAQLEEHRVRIAGVRGSSPLISTTPNGAGTNRVRSGPRSERGMTAKPDATQLRAVEHRLNAVLDRYRDRLEVGEIYGIPMLRRAGTKAHDWFAGVQVADGYVKFNFLPMHEHADLLDGISPALRKHKSGASVFRFTDVDETLIAELERVVARGFEVYTRD
jgi:hypothetical protein